MRIGRDGLLRSWHRFVRNRGRLVRNRLHAAEFMGSNNRLEVVVDQVSADEGGPDRLSSGRVTSMYFGDLRLRAFGHEPPEPRRDYWVELRAEA